MMKKWNWLALVFLCGCAGTIRDCSNLSAKEFGADWVVVQYKYDGTTMRCWKLKDIGVANEAQSDGIFWRSPKGHLVHLSGWYNRVQVSDGDFDGALKELGITDCLE